MPKQSICILCKQFSLQNKLINHLKDNYRLFFPETIQDLLDLLKNNEIVCIIANPVQYDVCRLWEFREIKDQGDGFKLSLYFTKFP